MIIHLKDLLDPSGIAAGLFVAACVALVVRRMKLWAFPLFAASSTIVVVFSSGLAATLLLGPLENSFPPLRNPRDYPEAQLIAVLTAYAIDDPEMPLSAQMNAPSAFRVLEAANLWSLRPDCTVVVSGSSPAAEIMARQLESLGIPESQLKVDADSDSTAESADYLRKIAGGRPVFLVTSAGHMRRAVGTFRNVGLAPIPAPTDYRLTRNPADAALNIGPSYLQASDLAFHEYLGLAWYRVTGRL